MSWSSGRRRPRPPRRRPSPRRRSGRGPRPQPGRSSVPSPPTNHRLSHPKAERRSDRRVNWMVGWVAGIRSAAVAANPPPDLKLTPINGPGRTVAELLTTFHLCFVALDPFTNESAWILPTAARILTVFEQADVRVAWVVAGTPRECRMFLGP